MDVPRLSTLQALLLILKARESAPQRGYYYRSWMTITQCVNMGKDLGLDEHYADHQADRPCGESNPVECQLKRRIWQAVFVVEVMIGSPQGQSAARYLSRIYRSYRNMLTKSQAAPISMYASIRSTSVSRDPSPTATKENTKSLEISRISLGSYAMSAR